jgi:hypothetical protein
VTADITSILPSPISAVELCFPQPCCKSQFITQRVFVKLIRQQRLLPTVGDEIALRCCGQHWRTIWWSLRHSRRSNIPARGWRLAFRRSVDHDADARGQWKPLRRFDGHIACQCKSLYGFDGDLASSSRGKPLWCFHGDDARFIGWWEYLWRDDSGDDSPDDWRSLQCLSSSDGIWYVWRSDCGYTICGNIVWRRSGHADSRKAGGHSVWKHRCCS